eukprot:6108769-Prymnesium_polylepis.1
MERGQAKAVRLVGAPDAVEAAAKAVQAYGPVEVRRVDVDDEQQGLLIGRKGATIDKLQETTGCSLDLRKPANQLVIAGPPEAVADAALQIREMLETQRRIEMVVKFDPEQKGTLLGKGGATINRIQQESGGALIELGKGEDSSVKICGPSKAVQAARAAVIALLHLDAESVRAVEVAAELVDAVVGRGGENLRQLEAEHEVSIDSTHRLQSYRSGPGERPTEACRIKVRGGTDAVKRAMDGLMGIIERERRVEETLEVESQHIGMLLGKGGMTINAIQKETGAVLDIQKRANEGSSTQRVTVKGNAMQVRKASAALEAVLQYEAASHEVIAIDGRMMPVLIGKGGEEINRIRSKTGAAIDAERDDPPKLKIRGTVEAVAAAKQLILDAIAANKQCAE